VPGADAQRRTESGPNSSESPAAAANAAAADRKKQPGANLSPSGPTSVPQISLKQPGLLCWSHPGNRSESVRVARNGGRRPRQEEHSIRTRAGLSQSLHPAWSTSVQPGQPQSGQANVSPAGPTQTVRANVSPGWPTSESVLPGQPQSVRANLSPSRQTSVRPGQPQSRPPLFESPGQPF
jgi:hypothetical protein